MKDSNLQSTTINFVNDGEVDVMASILNRILISWYVLEVFLFFGIKKQTWRIFLGEIENSLSGEDPF